MAERLSSRERMLAALECREPDYVPCCFSAFQILRQKCKDQLEYVEKQLEMGLDAMAQIQTPSVRFDPRVSTREWREDDPQQPYPLLHKVYETPAGPLRTCVSMSEDWPWGEHVPLMDDFLIPRSRKFLVTPEDNLEALRYLLAPPTDDDVRALRESAERVKAWAAERELPVIAFYGMVGDLAAWLCGIQELMMMTVDAPDFVHQVLALIEEWNRQRMELVLEQGVDVFVRRAWYENADFWSPTLYGEYLLPGLRRDAELAHAAGARFGYLMSCSLMPLLDAMLEAGVDVLLGVDPAQDRTMDLSALKDKADGKMCLWGGVCGYLTVECGTPEEISAQVRDAIRILGPGGGLILAPVTNIREDTPQAWRNVEALIEAWRRMRDYPINAG